jgi:hypothetical protein
VALADYVERLPDDDANLRVLGSLQEPYRLGVFSPSEEAARLMSRFGFHYLTPVERFDDFLADLAAVEAAATVDMEHDLGDDAG